MSTYLSHEVLDLVEHNRREPLEDIVRWRFALLDGGTGRRTQDAHDAASAAVRPYLWTVFTRAEKAVVRTFIDTHRGMAIPFWLPSYQKDLTLADDAVATDTQLTIDFVRYTQLLFGETGVRRHLALKVPGGPFSFHKVTSATDPGDGITETLGITPSLPSDFPKATTLVCFLRYSRLEDDRPELAHLTRDHADVVLHCRELPKEAPT